jgi:hypothetical protein
MLQFLSRFFVGIFVAFFKAVEAGRQNPRVAAIVVLVFAVFIVWRFFFANPYSRPQFLGNSKAIPYAPDNTGKSVIRGDVLEQAVTKYYVLKGRMPRTWEELDAEGIVADIPRPPQGMAYELDVTAMRLRVIGSAPAVVKPAVTNTEPPRPPEPF